MEESYESEYSEEGVIKGVINVVIPNSQSFRYTLDILRKIKTYITLRFSSKGIKICEIKSDKNESCEKLYFVKILADDILKYKYDLKCDGEKVTYPYTIKIFAKDFMDMIKSDKKNGVSLDFKVEVDQKNETSYIVIRDRVSIGEARLKSEETDYSQDYSSPLKEFKKNNIEADSKLTINEFEHIVKKFNVESSKYEAINPIVFHKNVQGILQAEKISESGSNIVKALPSPKVNDDQDLIIESIESKIKTVKLPNNSYIRSWPPNCFKITSLDLDWAKKIKSISQGSIVKIYMNDTFLIFHVKVLFGYYTFCYKRT